MAKPRTDRTQDPMFKSNYTTKYQLTCKQLGEDVSVLCFP